MPWIDEPTWAGLVREEPRLEELRARVEALPGVPTWHDYGYYKGLLSQLVGLNRKGLDVPAWVFSPTAYDLAHKVIMTRW